MGGGGGAAAAAAVKGAAPKGVAPKGAAANGAAANGAAVGGAEAGAGAAAKGGAGSGVWGDLRARARALGGSAPRMRTQRHDGSSSSTREGARAWATWKRRGAVGVPVESKERGGSQGGAAGVFRGWGQGRTSWTLRPSRIMRLKELMRTTSTQPPLLAAMWSRMKVSLARLWSEK